MVGKWMNFISGQIAEALPVTTPVIFYAAVIFFGAASPKRVFPWTKLGRPIFCSTVFDMGVQMVAQRYFDLLCFFVLTPSNKP